MKNKILLVEDDKTIANITTKYLEKAGFSVTQVHDGKSAIDFFEAYDFDLIVLDLNLPFLDGLKVAKHIKKLSNIPIIMLTARTTEVDELNGFRAGADDYVKKPFSPQVLIARIEKLLSKFNNTSAHKYTNPIIKFSTGQLCLDKRLIKINNTEYKLTKKQGLLLKSLLESSGSVVPREELLRAIASKSTDNRLIDALVKNLRKVIPPDFIQSVRGVGYKIGSKYV